MEVIDLRAVKDEPVVGEASTGDWQGSNVPTGLMVCPPRSRRRRPERDKKCGLRLPDSSPCPGRSTKRQVRPASVEDAVTGPSPSHRIIMHVFSA